MPYRRVTTRDWWIVGGYTLPAATVIVVTAWILIPGAWPIGFAVWLAVFLAGALFLLVKWHAKSTAYRCPACRYEFEISVLTDFASPQLVNIYHITDGDSGEAKWVSAPTGIGLSSTLDYVAAVRHMNPYPLGGHDEAGLWLGRQSGTAQTCR